MTCPSCGAANAPEARFCSQCGHSLLPDVELTGVLSSVEDTSDRLLNPVDAAVVDALPTGSGLLVVQKGPGAGSRFLLDRPEITAGRNAKSDIFFDDITVSRNHASFKRTGETFTVEDLHSLNGTYVNRERIESTTLLNDGDEVRIGKYTLLFFAGHED